MDELLREVRADLKELVKLAAVHNQILETHEKRSTQLEERFKPIEATYVWVSKLAALVLSLGAISAAVIAINQALRLIHS